MMVGMWNIPCEIGLRGNKKHKNMLYPPGGHAPRVEFGMKEAP